MPSDAPTEEPPLADLREAEAKQNETPIENAARASFGLRVRDRAEVYRDTAEAATDTDLAFWSVLLLSGAIATLGLALDATAVVIGAMLVAPLLGPLLGLAMAFAVGDGRLAVQTGITVVVGTGAVIALAAGITLLLPLQNVTSEIAARTRPTTLDLGIAVASGLAGAVVTLSRESRLSASIPGVAIAVALIPPMGVAGFALGTGFDWAMFRGAMLLFGANLAGIVLSATLAFMVVGMHRPDVVETARHWHADHRGHGLSAGVSRTRLFGRLRVFGSPWARVVMVTAFVIALAIPLTTSLQQILREQRVNQAISAAVEELAEAGAASVLSRDVTLDEVSTRVLLRVTSATWLGANAQRRFETEATARAGEPVALTLEQVIASDDDPNEEAPPAHADGAPGPLEVAHERVERALLEVTLPDSVHLLGASLLIGEGPPAVSVTYTAPRVMSGDAETVVAAQLARVLGVARGRVRLDALPTALRPIPADTTALARLVAPLDRFPALGVMVLADSATAAETRARLIEAGAAPGQVRTLPATPPGVHYFLDD